ncbi:MAG: hypothetical protein RLZZ352_394 [Pseudomonadota bacterium]|jgi:biopolymer transport protein ExbB
MNLWQTLAQADAFGQAVAGVLLLMSVASWVVILWKAWLLRRARRGLALCLPAVWQAPSLDAAAQRLLALERLPLLLPLLTALRSLPNLPAASLAAAADPVQQRTRVLRDALQQVSATLQYGQVLLASVGATAPFVGLLGTVWGIHQALLNMGLDERFRIEHVAGPVGEALVMTAAGLVVAIPAVLAYNVLGRHINDLEAELEGFAHDLRELPPQPHLERQAP